MAALYLPKGVKAEDALSDVPKRLEISYLVSIKGPDFDKGVGAGTELAMNGTPLIIIEGVDFAAAYFGIRLGREQSVAQRILWFILIMTLGNIAMAAYLLAQLRHIRSGDNRGRLFFRKVSP